MMQTQVAIVGGGLAGLSAVRLLRAGVAAARNAVAATLEKRSRLGAG